METIDTYLCVNDYRSGMCNHRLTALRFDDYELLSLIGCYPERHNPRFRETSEAIYVSGRKYRVYASREWVGNWCWNLYRLSLDDAVRLVNQLRGKGGFALEVAQADLYETYKAREITVDDLKAAMVV